MRYLYHATDFKNAESILVNGIKPSADGVVYMTENPIDCVKFLAIRGIRDIIVFRVKILKRDEVNIIETFDHNKRIFGCRCFGYIGRIEHDKINKCLIYKI